MIDKSKCPQCGQMARKYNGDWETHKVRDPRRKTVFSICNGKPPIKKEK